MCSRTKQSRTNALKKKKRTDKKNREVNDRTETYLQFEQKKKQQFKPCILKYYWKKKKQGY